MEIRDERPEDIDAIRDLTDAAFRDRPYSRQTEARVIAALRQAGALTLSLVLVEDGEIVGHAALSPVSINGAAGDWYGLGPVSVRPGRQRQGVGQALIREGLARLQALGAGGCVVLGDPGYYRRFGFERDPGLRYGAAPPGYFRRLVFKGTPPQGEVAYHPGFDVA